MFLRLTDWLRGTCNVLQYNQCLHTYRLSYPNSRDAIASNNRQIILLGTVESNRGWPKKMYTLLHGPLSTTEKYTFSLGHPLCLFDVISCLNAQL